MKSLSFFVFIFLCSRVYSQNLVANEGFELHSGLPSNPGQYGLSIGWSNCNGTGSPDYFHTNGAGLVQLPFNFVGTVYPYDGNAVMGFCPYYPSTPDFREYVSASLIDPLVPGNTYSLSFFITNGITSGSYGGQGIDQLSVAFTIGEPSQSGWNPIVSVTPQVTYAGILYDTAWQQVSFQFTATDAFDHITFGNFKNDANTGAQVFDFATSSLAYYFLDGILLEESNTGNSNFYAAANSLCEKFCTSFFDSSTNNPTSWQWYFEGGDPASSTDQNPGNVCYSAPGTFAVTLITNGTDTLTLPNFITVYPTPPLPTVTQSGYTLTSSSATTYQWQFNSVDIPGATNQSYSVTQSGYYSVFITDQNGCASSSPNLYVLITGMEDSQVAENISIYPNPSTESITLAWTNCPITDDLQIEMYNAIGQLVFSSGEEIRVDHFTKTIATDQFSSGVYFLSLQSNNKRLDKKFVINH